MSKYILSIAILFVITFNSKAQDAWHLYVDPPINIIPIQIEVSDDGTIYLLTQKGKIYYREPNEDWNQVKDVKAFWNCSVIGINPINKRLFVGTSGSGIRFTDDYGISWMHENFFTNQVSGQNESISSIGYNLVTGTILLGGSFNPDPNEPALASYRSTNNGDSWTGIPGALAYSEQFYLENGNVFASTLNGIGLSTDDGISWAYLSMENKRIIDFTKDANNNLYAVVSETTDDSETGVYVSLDQGESWQLLNIGLENLELLSIKYIPTSGQLLCGTKSGLYRFQGSWSNISNNIGESPINDIAWFGSNIYLGTTQKGININVDANAWEDYNDGILGGISDFVFSNEESILGIYFNTDIISTNDGPTEDWTNYSLADITENTGFVKNILKNNQGDIFVMDINELFRSTDGGLTFSNITPDIPFQNGTSFHFKKMYIGESGEILLYQKFDNRLYRSNNNGEDFELIQGISELIASPNYLTIENFLVDQDGRYYIVTVDLNGSISMFTSSDNDEWSPIDISNVSGFSPSTNLHLTNNKLITTFDLQPYLYNASNDEFTIINIPWDTSNPNVHYELFSTDDDQLYAIFYATFGNDDYDGVWRTNNLGETWENISFPVDNDNQVMLGDKLVLSPLGVPFIAISGYNSSDLETQGGIYYYGEEGAFVGIEELENSETKLLVYPNPISRYQTLSIQHDAINEKSKVVFLDVLGRKVPQNLSIKNHKITVNIDIHPGIYFIEVYNDNIIIDSHKIIVE